jgi:predicted outer membrane repeat protein
MAIKFSKLEDSEGFNFINNSAESDGGGLYV